MRALGLRRRISPAAAMPPGLGIAMSVTMTSGASASTALSSALPSLTAATTSNSDANNARKSSRTVVSSSAKRTRACSFSSLLHIFMSAQDHKNRDVGTIRKIAGEVRVRKKYRKNLLRTTRGIIQIIVQTVTNSSASLTDTVGQAGPYSPLLAFCVNTRATNAPKDYGTKPFWAQVKMRISLGLTSTCKTHLGVLSQCPKAS